MIKVLINKLGETRSQQWFYWGVIAMIAVAHILIYSIMPYTCDDYWYMTPLRDYCMGIDTSFPSEALWECWRYHYECDNIRLANVVFTFTLLIPKIIPSIISGLLVGVILWLSSKLSGLSWRNPLLMMMLAFMLSFMLPWYEEMFTQCFALNYIWSTALALWLAYIFFIKENCPHYIIMALLGLVMGAWHEGIAGPLLVGFVTYLVVKRRAVNRQRIAMIIGLVAGLIWLAMAPGLQTNVGYKTASLDIYAILSKLVLYHSPLLILSLSILIALIKKDTRKLIVDPIFVAFVAICIAGVALNFITNVGVRTGWMGYVFGIISIIYLWRNMKDARYGRGKSMLKRIITVAVALFLLAHYIVVVYYSINIRAEFDKVMVEYEKSPDGLVFADVTYDYQASPLAWKKPYFEIFTYDWVMYWKDKFYNDCNKQMRVIPTCLRKADELKGEKVKGNNPFMIYDGYLYAPIVCDDSFEKIAYYEIDFGPTKKRLKCSNFIFTTSSGKKYYFSFPQRATVHRWIGEIEEMNEVKLTNM
ncbi:MAG: hypothetical protein IJE73_01995 [Muribaculaceae bacterium]|nr:hypothetical protein [Muribaculaceae bacterium]